MEAERRPDVPALLASGVTFAAIAFVVAAIYSSFTIIQPGNVGVVFNRWSGAAQDRRAGHRLADPVDHAGAVLSGRAPHLHDGDARSEEGSRRGDDSIDLPTREGQHIRQDISVTYNTSQEKAADVFRSFRGADIRTSRRRSSGGRSSRSRRTSAGQMSLTDIISNQRGRCRSTIQTTLADEMEKMGFVVDKVNLGRQPPARGDREADAAEDGGAAAGAAGRVRAAAAADARQGEGRRGGGRRRSPRWSRRRRRPRRTGCCRRR